ncbi:MAG: alpha/beta hydrolase [Steroidobacteraceae bacterium]
MSPMLVLLPGLDGTGDLFNPLIAALGDGYPSVVVRYPCDEPLGYSALTDRVRALLPDDQPYVLLGESFSGPIAISLAAEQLPSLRGLILCGSFASSPWAWMATVGKLDAVLPVHLVADLLGARLLMGRFATPALRALLYASVHRVAPEVFRVRVHEALRVDVTRELAAVQVPALYLRATEDRVVPPTAGHKFASALQRATLVDVVGPHCLLQCSPEATAKEIHAFLRPLGG